MRFSSSFGGLWLMASVLSGAVACTSTAGVNAAGNDLNDPSAGPNQAGQPSSPAGVGTQPNAPAGPTTSPNASPNTTTPAKVTIKPIAWPNVGFVNNPGGNDPKAVALTFDDGPDGIGSDEGKAGKTNMSLMLDQLDKLGLKATFFLCGNMWTNALTDTAAQTDLKRAVAAGHAFGSHTSLHQTMDPNLLSFAQAQNQFVANESIFSNPITGMSAHVPFTMYRAPYGTPFQDGVVYPPTTTTVSSTVAVMAPATPPNAVHVGWGIDTKDWQCAQANQSSTCIMNNLNAFLDAGASGPILMHTVYKLSADTLPQVVQSIYDHNYHIVMVEDMIKAKYGASSADIAAANANATFDNNTIINAAVAAALATKWTMQTNEN